MKKILLNLLMMSGVIGFVTYLFIIISSFLSCCVGLDSFIYQQIVLGLVILGTVTLGVCMYNNCYKNIVLKK